ASELKALDAPTGTPARRPASGPKAQRILGVSQGSETGQLAFTIKADGTLRYQDFFLGNPDRLVIDFVDVVSRAPIRNMEVNQDPVRKVRLAQFSAASPKVARLVLDLSARAPFRLFADISGLNIVVNPGVSGKVTLKLNEVPWDQALDLILKANGLGYTLEGNVIRIARLADLQREEQELRKLQEEKALAGNLEVFNKT